MIPKIPANPFILVDGSSYLFRAYHGLPPLTTSNGQPTGAILGVTNMLRKLLNSYPDAKMVVVFDSKGKNFRHKLFPSYKANRTVMPDDLQLQIEPLHEIIKAMGLPLVVIPGVEADDIIGTLAYEAKNKGLFTLISTGDKDFAQLVDDKIFLINTMSAEIFDRQRVIDKFQVPPERIIDYLTLIGDSVDNIPGIPNVGPKTAVKWLEAYGSLDGVIENAEEISGKVGENLRNALADLPLFKSLVTIDTALTLPVHYQDIVMRTIDKEKLNTLFQDLEFKNWLRELDPSKSTREKEKISENETNMKVGQPDDHQKLAYLTILQQTDWETFFSELENASCIAFNTQTTTLDPFNSELVGIAVTIKGGRAAYIPFQHHYLGVPQQLPKESILKQIKTILENSSIQKIGHDLKFDMHVLEKYNIVLKGATIDIMLESYVLNSTSSKHDLITLANRQLKHNMLSLEGLIGKGVKQVTFDTIDIEAAGAYAVEKNEVILKLHDYFSPQLLALPKQNYIFNQIEMGVLPVLAAMERVGVLIDTQLLLDQSAEIAIRLEKLENEAYSLAGGEFNLASPKQLQEILFNRLKLPIIEKTPTGQPSTGEAVLQELAEKFDLPKLILEHRSLSKLKSTYTDKLPLQVNAKTGRIHTSYNQAVTTTGRLSSTDPNLQNIPIRTPEGRKIRKAFIATPGYKMVAVDYSQIELRIMAHLSQDKALIEAFCKDEGDIHRSTAAIVFGVALAEVTPDQRRKAKAINFGLMYGMSSFGLAKQLGIDRAEAELYSDGYFKAFPGVKQFMDNIKQSAKENGFVETLLGRRLYLPDLKASQAMVRKAAERAAINAPMQGTNADIIKLAMIELSNWFKQNKLSSRLIMQVHDELIFEVYEAELERVVEYIKTTMEHVTSLSVPLKVSVGMGHNWDEAH